ncbi:MAG: oligosaccharide flippase family protein [Gammaproteobacteria bacterium]|nr:oligosaccharide flippase family protein [Gammaproteobacteria bacterium]
MVGVALLSQLLHLVSYLVLTRNYNATELGAFAQFNVILLLLLPWASLAFPSALALANDEVQRFYLSKLAVFATVICATFVQLVFWGYWIYNQNANPVFLYGLFIAISGAGIASLAEQQYLLAGRLKQQAVVVLLVAFTSCVGRVLLALYHADVDWLLATAFLQPVVLAILYYLASGKSTEKKLPWCWSDLKQTCQQFSVFPTYQAGQLAFNAWSQSIPLLLFSYWFGLDVLAFLNIAVLLLVAPSMLLNKAVGDVYYPLVSRLLDNREQLWIFLLQCTGALFAVLLLPFSFLWFYAETIYAFLFGEEWRLAGQYALWLLPWYFLVCMNAPALKTLIVLRQQKLSFYLNIFTFIIRCFAIATGAIVFESVWCALGLYGAAGCIHNLVIIGLAFKAVTKNTIVQVEPNNAAT